MTPRCPHQGGCYFLKLSVHKSAFYLNLLIHCHVPEEQTVIIMLLPMFPQNHQPCQRHLLKLGPALRSTVLPISSNPAHLSPSLTTAITSLFSIHILLTVDSLYSD